MSTQAPNVSRENAFCFDYLDRNAKAIGTLNDSIFYFAELGRQEIKTADLMCELLEKPGFKSSAAFQDSQAAFVQPAAPEPLSSRSILSTMPIPITRRLQGR